VRGFHASAHLCYYTGSFGTGAEDVFVVPTGLYFEDWALEEVYETPARKISVRDVEAFGAIEGSKSPMHLDPNYASQTIWDRMTVHGLLTVSIAAGLMGASGRFDGTAMAFMELNWRFHAPVYVDDEIRVCWWVSDKRPTRNRSRGVITRSIEVLNQDDVRVCSGTMVTLWSRRESSEPELG
jgi:acyl dehydratase